MKRSSHLKLRLEKVMIINKVQDTSCLIMGLLKSSLILNKISLTSRNT